MAVGRRRLRGKPASLFRIGAEILALAPAMAFIPAIVVGSIWSEAAALKAEWTVAGPPCPVVDHPSPLAVSRRREPTTFEYGGARFTRAFAAASCAALPENLLWPQASYPVCQFNNPGAVTVAAGGTVLTFEPPVGRSATITVRDGAITCVVGAGFRL